MKTISCIIPAYNEGGRIARVLAAVVPLIGSTLQEVIVVDDGSQDETADVVRQFPEVTLIVEKTNRGKSNAVSHGVHVATSELILLLDADLVGISSQDVLNLVDPVLENKADVAISLRNYKGWRLIGLDPLSGERVFPKKLLEENADLITRLPGYGLEVFFNSIIIKKQLRIAIVLWKNVMSPSKYKKQGFWKGLKGNIHMNADIYETIGLRMVIAQIRSMHRLKIRH